MLQISLIISVEGFKLYTHTHTHIYIETLLKFSDFSVHIDLVYSDGFGLLQFSSGTQVATAGFSSIYSIFEVLNSPHLIWYILAFNKYSSDIFTNT